uniref:HNH endonuclease n=1 Tax=Escherichia phage phiEco273 TaxID=3239875 RepID=A0AB39JE97_9CAUD
MKMIFRNKHNGRFLTPIEVLPNYVRMYHEASDRVFWYKKATLHEHLQVVHHDVRVGDVLRDVRDGSLLEVLRVSTDGVMLRSGKTQRGVLLTGLVNYARVGRNYKLKRPGVVAKEITRTEHPYTKYDERKVREHIDNARAQAAAMIQAGNDAKRFGIGVILVYPDGSMKSTDPRGVIQK